MIFSFLSAYLLAFPAASLGHVDRLLHRRDLVLLRLQIALHALDIQTRRGLFLFAPLSKPLRRQSGRLAMSLSPLSPLLCNSFRYSILGILVLVREAKDALQLKNFFPPQQGFTSGSLMQFPPCLHAQPGERVSDGATKSQKWRFWARILCPMLLNWGVEIGPGDDVALHSGSNLSLPPVGLPDGSSGLCPVSFTFIPLVPTTPTPSFSEEGPDLSSFPDPAPASSTPESGGAGAGGGPPPRSATGSAHRRRQSSPYGGQTAMSVPLGTAVTLQGTEPGLCEGHAAFDPAFTRSPTSRLDDRWQEEDPPGDGVLAESERDCGEDVEDHDVPMLERRPTDLSRQILGTQVALGAEPQQPPSERLQEAPRQPERLQEDEWRADAVEPEERQAEWSSGIFDSDYGTTVPRPAGERERATDFTYMDMRTPDSDSLRGDPRATQFGGGRADAFDTIMPASADSGLREEDAVDPARATQFGGGAEAFDTIMPGSADSGMWEEDVVDPSRATQFGARPHAFHARQTDFAHAEVPLMDEFEEAPRPESSDVIFVPEQHQLPSEEEEEYQLPSEQHRLPSEFQHFQPAPLPRMLSDDDGAVHDRSDFTGEKESFSFEELHRVPSRLSDQPLRSVAPSSAQMHMQRNAHEEDDPPNIIIPSGPPPNRRPSARGLSASPQPQQLPVASSHSSTSTTNPPHADSTTFRADDDSTIKAGARTLHLPTSKTTQKHPTTTQTTLEPASKSPEIPEDQAEGCRTAPPRDMFSDFDKPFLRRGVEEEQEPPSTSGGAAAGATAETSTRCSPPVMGGAAAPPTTGGLQPPGALQIPGISGLSFASSTAPDWSRVPVVPGVRQSGRIVIAPVRPPVPVVIAPPVPVGVEGCEEDASEPCSPGVKSTDLDDEDDLFARSGFKKG